MQKQEPAEEIIQIVEKQEPIQAPKKTEAAVEEPDKIVNAEK
jgi:hypothetical protein